MRSQHLLWTLLLGTLPAAAADGQTDGFPAPQGYRGSADCLSCHINPPPSQLIGRSQDLVALLESQAFLPADERSDVGKRLFQHRDPHFRAYQTMIEPAGAVITDRLGWTHTGQAGEGRYAAGADQHHQELLANARSCLACHVNWHPAHDQPPPDYRLQGIGCEACHGASKSWFEPHTDVAFRLKTAEQKHALGMVDVRNPAARARQCYSCHIGDVPSGKLVTHEMYAAGHPPLPAIEIETFAATTQRHWRSLAEKGRFAHRDAFVEAAGLKLREDELPRTKGMLIGAVAAFRQSAQLTADVAAAAESDRRSWPQLAVYDCQACHHDLQADGWRQLRGYRGPPGRIYPPSWPTALARAAMRLDSVRQYRAAFDSPPFGEPQRVAERAAQLVEDLDALTRRIEEMTVSRGVAAGVRDALLRATDPDRAESLLDYHSAVQLANGLFIVESELQLPRRAASAEQLAVDPRGYPQFAVPEEAERLATDAAARYRAGRQDFAMFLDWKAAVLDPSQQAVHRRLQQSLPVLGLPDLGDFRSHGQLPAIRTYDARQFARQLQALSLVIGQ